MSNEMSISSQSSLKRPDSNAALMPPVDVTEDASGITLLADLPGVPKEKLSLNVESDLLTIEGELELNTPEGMQAAHADVGLTRFKRTFTLSKELDTEHVSAEFNQGVLKLRIPKAAHAQPKRINIQLS